MLDLRQELVAALVALTVGAPLFFLFARSAVDGERRRSEAPVRAMIGDSAFEAAARREKTAKHYFGNTLLAPDFRLDDAHGRPWQLSEQRGNVVVLNFWSVTCQPCVQELPSLNELARMTRHRKDIQVVAVSTDKGPDEVAAVLPPNNELTILFDSDKSVVRDRYGTKLYPETWIVDARGVIRLRVDGRRDWSSALALQLVESFL